MIEWLSHLPVAWMAVVVFVATGLVTSAIYAVVMALATGERARAFKAMSPVMLTPLAVVFGLIVAFLAAQVWSDVERANSAVAREANALRKVTILAAYLPEEQGTRIRALVRDHIQRAVNEEWPAMAGRRADVSLISPTAEGIKLALSMVPKNEAQAIAQRELVSALESALEARRNRIIISESTINWVKSTVINVLAALLLVVIAIVHSDNRVTAAISMSVFSVAVAACIVLIAPHNRPFTGQISVGPSLLLQVMPDEKP